MKMTVKTEGMMCMRCVERVEKAFAALGLRATADLAAATVTVEGESFTADTVKTAIEELGFGYLGAS